MKKKNESEPDELLILQTTPTSTPPEPSPAPSVRPAHLAGFKSEIICVIGTRGSGKTFLVKNALLEPHQPYIIFDTIGEYDDLDDVSDADDVMDIIDLMEIGENIRVEYDTVSFEDVCFLLNQAKQPYWFIVDEFHVLYEHHMNFQAECPSFKNLVLLGNHNYISMIVTTQRPTDFPKYLLSQCTTLYSFQIWHKKDIEFISHIINDPEQFQNLELYHYKQVEFTSPMRISEGKTSL